jgi:uncharacterized protein (TIGR03437 family)
MNRSIRLWLAFALTLAGILCGTVVLSPTMRTAQGYQVQTDELSTDDGSWENGIASPGILGVNRLTPRSYPARLDTIRIHFKQITGQPSPVGKQIRLVAFAGAAGTTAPANNSQLLFNQMVVIPAFTSTGFADFPVQNGPTINGGDFYVGFQTPDPLEGVTFSNDTNGPPQQRAFFSFDNGQIYQGQLITGNLMIRALVTYSQPAAIIGVDPSTLSFGNVVINTSADRTVTVRNTGAAPLVVSDITSSNPRFSVTTGSSFSVTPGGQQIVTVRFSPNALGVANGVLTIKSNDSANPEAPIALSGTGVDPNVALVSGAPLSESIPAPSPPNTSVFGTNQYVIQVPSSAIQLAITVTSAQNVNLYARLGQRVAAAGGQITADYKAESPGGNESIVITLASSPPLQSGAYFIGLNNLGPGAATFTLTATVTLGSGGQDVLGATDDGTSEGGVGGSGLIVVNRLTPSNYPATLKTVRILFEPIQNEPNPSGAQIRLLAFAGAAGTTAPPSNPQFLLDRMVTIPTITSPVFVDFPIQNGPTIDSGDFYIGFQIPNPPAGVFFSSDSNGPQQQRAFASFDGRNYQPLVALFPPTPRNILIRAVFSVFPEAVSVSGANFQRVTLAPEMIVAAFGVNLATGTEVAATITLPTILRGTTVSIKDGAGIERSAQLFFVSAGQVNYYMPPGTAAGPAIVKITSGSGQVSFGTVQIASVSPGVFTATSNGLGLAAALVLRVRGTQQTFEQISMFDAAASAFVPIPVDLGPQGDQVFLIMFGTGWRFRSGLSGVIVKVGGRTLAATFAGAAPGFTGLDQLNFAALPRDLAGAGLVDIEIVVDGKAANTTKVSIK